MSEVVGLRLLTLASLLLLFLAARHARTPLAFAAGLALPLLLFWGLPYFAPSPSHALGDSIVVLGLAIPLVWRGRAFVPLCALYGSTVVYFEFLTGQLPVAMGLLFPLAAVAARAAGESQQTAMRDAASAVGAFAAGAVATLAIKQILTALAIPGTIGNFAAQLQARAGSASGGRLLEPLARLYAELPMLTLGERRLALLVLITASIAWLVAAILAWKSRHVWDFAAFIVGALVIPAWIFLLPSHTAIHAPFMTRVLVVPIALGFAALGWQLTPERERPC